MTELNKLFWKIISLGSFLIILGLLTSFYYIGSVSFGLGIGIILIAPFNKIALRF